MSSQVEKIRIDGVVMEYHCHMYTRINNSGRSYLCDHINGDGVRCSAMIYVGFGSMSVSIPAYGVYAYKDNDEAVSGNGQGSPEPESQSGQQADGGVSG